MGFMRWLLFALFALFAFAISSLIDGLSIKKYIKNPKIYLFYSVFLQGVIGIFIFFFKEINFYGYFFLLISLVTGFFYVYGLIPYMKSLEFEEVSRIVPLFNLGPVFVLIFSLLVLDLKLSLFQYIGFFFLVTGSFLISLKKVSGFIKISKGFWYMMLTNLLLTGFFIGTDYLFKNYDYWSSFFFIQFGVLFSAMSLLVFKNYGQAGIKRFNYIGNTAKMLVLFAAVISFIGIGVRNVAIRLSSATLVTSLGGFQSLFVFGITLFLSIKLPYILKEETNKEIILLKTISILLLIAGIYFVSI